MPKVNCRVIYYSNSTYKMRKLFSCRKLGRETRSRLLFAFWKSFIRGKSKWSAALFQYISIVLNLGYSKNKLYRTLDNWSKVKLNFTFLEKGLGVVSLPYFVYGFSRKMFLNVIFYWPNFVVWLSLLPEILDNMCIVYMCSCLFPRLWRHKSWN